MQSNYALFFRRVLEDEGTTYEDVPGDNGGPTKCGITIADVARWNGVRCPARGTAGWADLVVKVRALDPATAGQIYKRYYWDAVRADDLPSGLDYAVVDYAVNSGVGRAIPTLAKIVGYAGKTVDDGMLKAVQDHGSVPAIINSYQDARKAFLEQIAQIPHNAKFRKGWLNREDRVRKVSLDLARRAEIIETPVTPLAPKAIQPGETFAPEQPAPSSMATAMVYAKNAYASRSIWAAIAGGFWMVWGVITDGAHTAWEWLLWLLDIVPKAKDEVDGVVSPLNDVASWFHINLTNIALIISAGCFIIFIGRHLMLRVQSQQQSVSN